MGVRAGEHAGLPRVRRVWELSRDHGRTVVMVMHDLYLATRYADHLIAMKRGKVIAEGPPKEIVTADLIKQVFDIEANVMVDPVTGSPLTIPTTGFGPQHQPMGARSETAPSDRAAPLFDGHPPYDLDPAAGLAETTAVR